MDYLQLIKKVFPNDGTQNNIKLLESALHLEYVDEYLDRGFIFASFSKKAMCDVGSKFLSYNDEKINSFRKDNDGYIGLLVVDPEFQGMGIGKKLINNFVNKCKEMNIKNIYLWTDLTCNKEFYDKLSFKIVLRYNNPYFEEFCNIKCEGLYNTIIYKLELS